MRRISPKTIIKLTHFFYSKIIPYLPKSSNRGRPQTYPDHQIISMLLIKEVFNLSQRNYPDLQRLFQKSSILERFSLQSQKTKTCHKDSDKVHSRLFSRRFCSDNLCWGREEVFVRDKDVEGDMKMKYLDMLQCTGKIWKWCRLLLSFWCTTCM